MAAPWLNRLLYTTMLNQECHIAHLTCDQKPQVMECRWPGSSTTTTIRDPSIAYYTSTATAR